MSRGSLLFVFIRTRSGIMVKYNLDKSKTTNLGTPVLYKKIDLKYTVYCYILLSYNILLSKISDVRDYCSVPAVGL